MDDVPDLPPGALLFKWAALIDKFHCTPATIGGLTDAQIDQLLLHKRTKDGALIPPELPVVPKPAPTKESRLSGIAQLEMMGLITAQRAQELRDEVNRGS